MSATRSTDQLNVDFMNNSPMDWKAEIPQRLLPVVKLLAHGYTPEQIGDELCLATSTVRNKIQEAREIIDARNAVQLAAFYFYSYTNISKDFAPICRRVGAFFSLLLFLIGVTHTDCERVLRLRRGRRRDDITLISDEIRPDYNA